MTFDQETESNSDHNNLPALISTASNDQPGGLMPNDQFPDYAASGLQPFSDLPIIFPTETKPVNGYDAALNAAALTVSTLGVICLLPGYLGKAENDFIWVEINGVRGPTHTVTQEEIDLDQIIVLFMDPGRFIDQTSNTVQAFVQRLSGTIDKTKLFNFLADREPPVGRDPIVSTPYNDNMSPVRFTNPQIEDFGVITDTDIGSGVSIQIANYPLNRAEPHVHYRKEDDVIHLSIGGVIIKHTVTSFEASGNNPITITAYFGTWNQLPNGTHLVEWFVVDKAGNPSPGFSPPRLIELRAGSGVEPLLPMVFVTESDYDPESDQDFINVPDLNGDATIELSIRGLGYSVNDQVILTVRGLADNVPTAITLDYDVLNPNLQRALIPLPRSFLLPLASGRILITYKRVRSGVPDRHSLGSLYNIFGDPISQRLPPPEVQGLVNGALPEDTNPVHIVVPHYLGQNSNDRVDLIVVGFPANGRPTYASYTEMAGIGDVQFFLDNDFFGALSGGHFEVHYLINRGVPRPASETATVSVGQAQDALPAPTTLQAVPPDFRFNPLVHKANLNVRVQPHPLIVAGTQLRLIFVGSAAGGSFTSAWFTVDENWEDTEIPFTVSRNIVLNNEGGSAHLYYELKLATPGPNKFSLELPIKIGMPRELSLPSILPTTPISSTRVELNPTHVIAPQPRTIEIRVVSDKFPRDADIKVNIKGKPGIGNPNIPARPAAPEPGENYTRFQLLSDFVAAYLDGEFTVSYQLIESSGTTISGDLTVEVLALPSSLLDLVSIPEASGGVINTAGSNNVQINKWPFCRAGQALWIYLTGTLDLLLRPGREVTPDEFSAGKTLDQIPPTYLDHLKHGDVVTVKAYASLDGTGEINSAVSFKEVSYAVSALNLRFVNTPYSVGPDGTLNNVELILGSDSRNPSAVVVTIPTTFSYADGSTGSKAFLTDENGALAIPGIRAPNAAGSYIFSATSGAHSATAEVTVKSLLPAGSIINLRRGPSWLAFLPNNLYFYASLSAVGAIVKIDSSSGEVLKEIDMGTTVRAIHCSTDGKKLYIPAGNSIIVVDTTDDKITNRIPVNGISASHTLDLSPDGKYIFTMSHQYILNSANVLRISTASETFDRAYRMGNVYTSNALCSADSTSFYTMDYQTYGYVYRYNIESGASTRIYTTGSSSNNMILSPDRSILYINNWAASTHSTIIALPNLQAKSLSINIDFAYCMSGNRQNTRLISANNTTRLLMDTASGAITRRFTIAGRGLSIFSPDDQTIYHCEENESRISITAAP